MPRPRQWVWPFRWLTRCAWPCSFMFGDPPLRNRLRGVAIKGSSIYSADIVMNMSLWTYRPMGIWASHPSTLGLFGPVDQYSSIELTFEVPSIELSTLWGVGHWQKLVASLPIRPTFPSGPFTTVFSGSVQSFILRFWSHVLSHLKFWPVINKIKNHIKFRSNHPFWLPFHKFS